MPKIRRDSDKELPFDKSEDGVGCFKKSATGLSIAVYAFIILLTLTLVYYTVCGTSEVHAATLDGDPLSQFVSHREERESKLTQDAYAAYIESKRPSATNARVIVNAIVDAGQSNKVDEVLIAAIISVESNFDPHARSLGAEGLMQVIPRYHSKKVSKVGGRKKFLIPANNVWVGTAAFKEYLAQSNNNVTSALLKYNGSSKDPSKTYARKVLAEKQRIETWVAAYVKRGTQVS